MISVENYLALALALFLIGFFGAVCSKNLIKILISIEFMLIAVGINFISMNSYINSTTQAGQIFTIFINAVGACEIAVALALILAIYKYKPSIVPEDFEEIKD